MAQTEEQWKNLCALQIEWAINFFGEDLDEALDDLRQSVDAERARRKRLAEEYPEKWVEATTTPDEMERWHQERLLANANVRPHTPEQRKELEELVKRLRVKHKDRIEQAWANRKR